MSNDRNLANKSILGAFLARDSGSFFPLGELLGYESKVAGGHLFFCTDKASLHQESRKADMQK